MAFLICLPAMLNYPVYRFPDKNFSGSETPSEIDMEIYQNPVEMEL
jgi:hypothetical protein